MRPIIFIKYYQRASTILAADQISAGLRRRGVESYAVVPRRIRDFRDAVMIFIKTSKLYHLWQARRQGNRVVLDVHDTVVYERSLKNGWLFDGFIFKNRRQLDDFGRPGRHNAVIYHHWDPRYGPHTAGEKQLAVGFLGERLSFPFAWNSLPGVQCIDRDYFKHFQDFNCHLSVRRPGRAFLYKPGTKVSTAAGCEAVLITVPDESACEMLGEDYPFYITGARPADTLEAVDRVRQALGGPEWRAARARLNEVKERTRLERIIEDYLDYLKELE